MKKSVKPILTRYYLWSSKWFGVKLHHIKKSDPEFHTHPWWGVSIIFGGYREQYEDDQRERRRLFVNLISPWRGHRVLTDKPVWTMFIHGPRLNEGWRYGASMAPWRGPDPETLKQSHDDIKAGKVRYL